MVQIPALSSPECQEGLPSLPGGQQDEELRIVNHVQVKHYQIRF